MTLKITHSSYSHLYTPHTHVPLTILHSHSHTLLNLALSLSHSCNCISSLTWSITELQYECTCLAARDQYLLAHPVVAFQKLDPLIHYQVCHPPFLHLFTLLIFLFYIRCIECGEKDRLRMGLRSLLFCASLYWRTILQLQCGNRSVSRRLSRDSISKYAESGGGRDGGDRGRGENRRGNGRNHWHLFSTTSWSICNLFPQLQPKIILEL